MAAPARRLPDLLDGGREVSGLGEAAHGRGLAGAVLPLLDVGARAAEDLGCVGVSLHPAARGRKFRNDNTKFQ